MQDNREDIEKITVAYAGLHEVGALQQNIRFQNAIENVRKELSTFNMNRGHTSGFVFEDLHVAYKNSVNLELNNGEVLNVINDNGIADFRLTDAYGNVSYQQAKMGYHNNTAPITVEKYGGQILVVDKGNSELIKHGEKIGLSVEESGVSRSSADNMTAIMKKEGSIRSELGLSNSAPVTANLFVVSEQLKYTHIAGIKAAKGGAAFSAGISFGKNMYEFLEGNAELRDVLLNTEKDAVIAAGGSYIAGGAGYLVSGALANTAVSTLAAQATGAIASTGVGATIISLGPVVTAMSAAVGPLFVAGMVIGTGYAAIRSIKIHSNKYRHRISQINQVLDQVLVSMKTVYEDLDQSIKTTYSFWDKDFAEGFDQMIDAVKHNDFEQFSSGLDVVLKVFGDNVLFKDMDEFDDFFFDDNAVLTL